MCGIAGFLDLDRATGEQTMRAVAGAMADALRHRGPDSRGVWVDAAAGVALGHRRLSILDLSHEGRQPMTSADGRYVLSYNGEIYNHRELRRELEAAGAHFRGRSDTEVLLAAVQRWGLQASLARANGMFALALWDRTAARLHLVRDRLGEKPLYVGWFGRTLVFGSELRALRHHPAFVGETDRGAVALLLRHNCIPAPHSILRGVWKLPPASLTTVCTTDSPARPPQFTTYWSLGEVVEKGWAARRSRSERELVDELDQLLRDAVKLRMEADVPLGAFLSGGIDSSAVVALMQAQSDRPVRTFTIGFEDPAMDESGPAAAVAAHLGTDHSTLRVTSREMLDVVPRLPSLYDEPFADSSQIPTVLVSELARRHVTVTLSGDGGDEVFGGYNRYVWAPAIWRQLRAVPRPVRRAGAALVGRVPQRSWDAVFAALEPVLPRRARVQAPGLKIHKLAELAPTTGPMDIYRTLTSHWKQPETAVRDATEPPTLLSSPGGWPDVADPVALMMYLDIATYLPDDILVKVDRATMSVGLEARVPYLDHRVVEYGWSLPLEAKIRGGEGKWLLRRLLERYIPASLWTRPKAGFGVPLGSWLRGPLRPWAEELLDPRALERVGLFRPHPVRRAWSAHLHGRADLPYPLWDVLMMQAWAQAWAGSS